MFSIDKRQAAGIDNWIKSANLPAAYAGTVCAAFIFRENHALTDQNLWLRIKQREGVTMIRLNNFFLSKQNDKEHREHINYALELENALSSLEAEAHESDDPIYIITHALKSACDF